MRYLLFALLLSAVTACQSSPDHARAIAAQALPRYAVGLRPTSLRTYPMSTAELNAYLRADWPARGGYLVTYACQVATPQPHQVTFAVFVDEADSVREFVPERNIGLFATTYGVDYR